MRYAFDLDGTLADTRDAVFNAYIEAGVTPPSDFFERTASEWVPSIELHERKNQLYLSKYVHTVKRLPLIDMLIDLAISSKIYVLTGASEKAAHALLRQIGILPTYVRVSNVRAGLTKEGKAEHLNSIAVMDDVVMFEDSLSVAEYLKENTKCTVCLVRYR